MEELINNKKRSYEDYYSNPSEKTKSLLISIDRNITNSQYNESYGRVNSQLSLFRIFKKANKMRSFQEALVFVMELNTLLTKIRDGGQDPKDNIIALLITTGYPHQQSNDMALSLIKKVELYYNS